MGVADAVLGGRPHNEPHKATLVVRCHCHESGLELVRLVTD